MTIAAILFDLDGTLVDSERESAEALARALQAMYGIVISQEDRDFVIGRSWVAIDANIRSRYPVVQCGRADLINAAVREREVIFAEEGLQILPGATEAVRSFAHLPRALVTGSARVEAEQVLRALSLTAEFDIIVPGDETPESKPSPLGYHMAAQALGVAIEACVVVEDSVSGIEAGRRAGARVIAVQAGNFIGADQSAAHAQIATLRELTPAWLAEFAKLPA